MFRTCYDARTSKMNRNARIAWPSLIRPRLSGRDHLDRGDRQPGVLDWRGADADDDLFRAHKLMLARAQQARRRPLHRRRRGASAKRCRGDEGQQRARDGHPPVVPDCAENAQSPGQTLTRKWR